MLYLIFDWNKNQNLIQAIYLLGKWDSMSEKKEETENMLKILYFEMLYVKILQTILNLLSSQL